jgi:membrane protein required for colicin V production
MIWIDFTLIGLVFICVVLGLLRGLIKEVFSLAFWILATWVSLRFSPEFCRIGSLPIATLPPSLAVVAGFLESAICQPAARPLASFVALFIITLSFGGLIGFLLGVVIEKNRLSFMDRFGGMIFGAVRGMAVITVVVIVAGLTPLPKDSWWTESTLIPPFQLLAVWLRDHLSPNLVDSIGYR